jgi:hypothetical protein
MGKETIRTDDDDDDDDDELNSQGPITESARIQKIKTQTNIREKQINR